MGKRRGPPFKMALKPSSWYRQSGVVAIRRKNGAAQVLLVTSNGGRRWVIPKGIVEKGLSPARSAAKEAWEEAGVTGAVSRRMLGRYAYEKWGGFCTVNVYLLKVRKISRAWPEAHVRRRKWLAPAKAAARVGEPELRPLILSATAGHGVPARTAPSRKRPRKIARGGK